MTDQPQIYSYQSIDVLLEHARQRTTRVKLLENTLDALRKDGIRTIHELTSKTHAEILRKGDLGRKAVNALMENLAVHGLYLADKNPMDQVVASEKTKEVSFELDPRTAIGSAMRELLSRAGLNPDDRLSPAGKDKLAETIHNLLSTKVATKES